MELTHICIVTKNVRKMADFYRGALRIEPIDYGDEYVEFKTRGGILSIFAFSEQEKLAPGSTRPASNRNVMIEYNVSNVDAEYERLKMMKVNFVKTPTTQAWGNRSVYFRDPDGNLINFYTRI